MRIGCQILKGLRIKTQILKFLVIYWIGGGAPSVVPYEDIATAAASCASPPPPRLVPLAKLLLRSNFSCPSPSSSPETALRILFPPLPNLPLPVQRRGLDAGSFAGQRLRRIESEQRQHHRRSRSLLLKGPMSAISDQKKRTLESLQQQYTAAKAKKLHDEHLKCHKKSNFDAPKTKFDTPRKGKAPELTPRQTSAQSSSHKGTAFSGSNRQQKSSASSGKDVNPVYAELSCPLHENLFQDGNSGFDSTEVVQSVIYDIIQKGGDSGKITKGGKKLKLEKGILLDNYVQRVPRLVDAQARSLLIHSKRSKQHMSLKQHKKCGSFDLDCTFHKYDLYKPMHEMWKAYITELTKITPKKQLSENLLSADLHGALLIVAECKAAPYQGISGIMIRDTAETFGIISEDNRFRVVPKAGSVFILQADCWKVTLIGDKLSPKLKLKEGQHQQRTQSQIR